MPDAVADLRRYLVQVLDGLGEGVEGTGFVCHAEGYALTCWHVVSGWGERGLKGEVRWQGRRVPAELVVERSVEAADLAVLKLGAVEGGAADGAWPVLPLEVHGRLRLQDALRSFGYPRGRFDQSGIPIRGEIGGLEAIRIGGVEALPIAGLNLDNVDAGYSGAPVLDERTQKVIGLVHAKQHGTQAFIVPLAPLFAAWPELRTAHDVFERIRRHLGAQAQAALDEKLHAAPFIPLRLEGGRVGEQGEGDRGKGDAQPHHRTWEAFDLNDLLPLRGRFILSADVGTGKTTFVQWLATELVRRTHQVPVVVACEQLERLAPKSLDDLLAAVAERLPDNFLSVDREEALADAHGKGRLVFLFDGLDQISGERPSEVTKLAFSLAGHAPVLISSRPSAVNRALEGDRQLTFLRLQPFSVRDQRQYFGARYEAVKAVCALAPELTQVPMLAYMVRELAAAGTLPKEATRTELYGQFVRHVLTEHEGNVSLQDKPGLIDKVEPVLARLAFDALAAARPHIQRVPVSVYTDDGRVPLRDLIAFGLVNRLLGRGEEVLYFTHQSFQEYLAARHAASRPEAVDQILTERWHPKWAEVIRFLAGLNGEDILERILAGPDNVIHSNLFLAAQCAGETRDIKPARIKSIRTRLLTLAETEPFRERAIVALGQLGPWQDETTVQALVRGLRDADRDLRKAAYSAFGKQEGPVLSSSLAALVEALVDKSPQVRSAAVEALGQFGDRLDARAFNAVVRRLEDKQSSVRVIAVRVLRRLRDQLNAAALSALRARLEDKNEFVQRVTISLHGELGDQLDDEALKALLGRVRDRSPAVRGAAIAALGRLGDRIGPDIRAEVACRLSDDNNLVQFNAASVLEALADRNGTDGVSLLVEWMRDGNAGVRGAAMQLLLRRRDRLDSAAISALIHVLGDEDLRLREYAAFSLGSLGHRLDADHLARLATLLDAEDPGVRSAAAKALGRLGDRLELGTLAAIESLLGDQDEAVREAAVTALEQLADRLDAATVALIADQLRGEHRGVRAAAIRALGKMGARLGEKERSALNNQLSDLDPDMRGAAVQAFAPMAGELNAKEIASLMARARDSEDWVREAAVNVLGQLGERADAAVRSALLAALGDDTAFVRCAAVTALGQVWDRLSPAERIALVDRLGDKDRSVREAVSATLASMGNRVGGGSLAAVVAYLHANAFAADALLALTGLYRSGTAIPSLSAT